MKIKQVIGKTVRYYVDGERVNFGAIVKFLYGAMEHDEAAKALQSLLLKNEVIINKHCEAAICPTCKQEVLPF